MAVHPLAGKPARPDMLIDVNKLLNEHLTRKPDLARPPQLRSLRASHRADGIVITPSHNPPRDGGFKYNPPHGGPADTDVTQWIQDRANALLKAGNREVKRTPITTALKASTTHATDFVRGYVDDL